MKTQINTLLVLIFTTLATAGCTNMKIQDFKDTKPELRIEQYFKGKTKASGLFQDRFGKVRRQFDVDIKGTWDENNQTLTLVEDFVYNDGATETRKWTIKKTGEDSYSGTAGGVVGEAVGKSEGNAFNFKYTFDLPVNGDTWRVKFDDWMYLHNNDVLFNKATIYRWGFRLGDVYIFFNKDD